MERSMSDDPAAVPELHSLGHVRRALPKIYGIAKFDLPAGLTPGEVVGAEYGQDLTGQRLGALFALVDEMTALLRFLSVGLIVTSVDGEADAGIYYRLCVKAIANLASLRALCLLGFDGNARIQLRLHYETMVLWSRLRVDPEARAAFGAAASVEASNHFWHQYLAHRKSEKFIKAWVKQEGGLWLGASELFADRVPPILGISSHPSNLEMSLNAQEDWKAVKADKYVAREVSDASHFTLGSAIWICAFPFIVGTQTVHELKLPSKWTPPESNLIACTNAGSDYYAEIQRMVGFLFLFAQPFIGGLNSEAPE
jgi:hypothetical protein